MSDDFLLAARSDWTGQPAAIGDMRQRLRRSRWLPLALLCFELAAALFGFSVGVWFALVALETGRLVFILSAAVMLISMPAVALSAFLVRRGALRWEDETPESVLRLSIRRGDAALAALRLSWGAVGLIAGFVVLLWALQLAGAMQEFGFLVAYSATSTLVCALCTVWLLWRRPRVLAERAASERLLRELAEA